jgi:hypothetical protein
MDIDTLDGFLNLISDNDIFEGDGFYDLLIKITNYPNIQKSISLLTKLLPYVDLNKKFYKVRYEEEWPIEFFYEKTYDEYKVRYYGDWDDFDYNFKGSIFTKIYFSEIGYDILRLLFESGADPNNINTLLDMMTKDWSDNPDMLEHKKDLIDILLEYGTSLQYLLDYLIANDNNYYCTEVIDYLEQKKIRSQQILSLTKGMYSREGPFESIRFNPTIIEDINKQLQNIKIKPDVRFRMLTQNKQKGSGKKKKIKNKKNDIYS